FGCSNRAMPNCEIMSAQQHQSDPRILDRRTLHKDHRRLAGVLARGMSVLDVGCGTGAITKGIIVPDGSGISDVTSPGDTRVFADRAGESAAPMDISIYRRPRDDAIFAIVAPKTG